MGIVDFPDRIGKYNKLKNEILKGEFEQFMMGQPYHTEKEVVFYFFMADLIGEKEDDEYHNLA